MNGKIGKKDSETVVPESFQQLREPDASPPFGEYSLVSAARLCVLPLFFIDNPANLRYNYFVENATSYGGSHAEQIFTLFSVHCRN